MPPAVYHKELAVHDQIGAPIFLTRLPQDFHEKQGKSVPGWAQKYSGRALDAHRTRWRSVVARIGQHSDDDAARVVIAGSNAVGIAKVIVTHVNSRLRGVAEYGAYVRDQKRDAPEMVATAFARESPELWAQLAREHTVPRPLSSLFPVSTIPPPSDRDTGFAVHVLSALSRAPTDPQTFFGHASCSHLLCSSSHH